MDIQASNIIGSLILQGCFFFLICLEHKTHPASRIPADSPRSVVLLIYKHPFAMILQPSGVAMYLACPSKASPFRIIQIPDPWSTWKSVKHARVTTPYPSCTAQGYRAHVRHLVTWLNTCGFQPWGCMSTNLHVEYTNTRPCNTLHSFETHRSASQNLSIS